MLENIISMRSANGGFFRLKNVRMTVFTYCDIEILIDEGATREEGYQKMMDWHLKCKADPSKFQIPGEDNYINSA
jgi:hypothetical protein